MKIGKVTWTWRLCGTTPIYPKRGNLAPSMSILVDWNFLGLSIKDSNEKHWPLISFWVASEAGKGLYYFDGNFWGSKILKKKMWDILGESKEEVEDEGV